MVVSAGKAGAGWRWAAWRMAVSCFKVMARVVGVAVDVGAEFPCGLGGGVVGWKNTPSAAPGRGVTALRGPSPADPDDNVIVLGGVPLDGPGDGGDGVDGTLSAVPGGGVVKIGDSSPVGLD